MLRAELRQPGLTVTAETTADDVDGWDSLTHTRLLQAVERAFGIAFAPHEGWGLLRVGDLAALVASRLHHRSSSGRRKLIVYGNCQAGAVAVVLRNTPAVASRYEIVSHDLWAQGEQLARDLADFAEADLLLLQEVGEWKQHRLAHALPPALRVVRFPFYRVTALWPFDPVRAGHDEKMHHAVQAAEAAGRRLPFGFQDSLLARLRETVADPEERFWRYCGLDIEDAPDIGRLAELEEARLLADDATYGSSIGRYIVDRYRHERLFHAIAHPTKALIARVTTELLARAGIDPGAEGVGDYTDYMGDYQVPLHPRVIRDLGLRWADGETRYALPGEPPTTFEAYIRRYIAAVPD